MKKIIRIIFMALGAILFMNGIFLAAFTNFNTGVLLTFGFGLVLFSIGWFWIRLGELMQKRPMQWLAGLVALGLAFMLGVIGFIAVYGQQDTADFQEKAVIVLGAGIRGETPSLVLRYRLESCLDYLTKNPKALVVVTGGRGPQEEITEALAMERYLLEKGVPKEQIVREEKATSTFENFVYSKQILDQQFQYGYTAALITNDFHIYRASRLAEIAGITAHTYHAKLDFYSVPNTYVREFLAVLKLWILKV